MNHILTYILICNVYLFSYSKSVYMHTWTWWLKLVYLIHAKKNNTWHSTYVQYLLDVSLTESCGFTALYSNLVGTFLRRFPLLVAIVNYHFPRTNFEITFLQLLLSRRLLRCYELVQKGCGLWVWSTSEARGVLVYYIYIYIYSTCRQWCQRARRVF